MPLERGEDGDLELFDALYYSLGRSVRRRILFTLLELDPRTALAVPDDVRRGETPRDRLVLELHHHHLPLLEDAGFVRWDRDGEQLLPGPRFTEVSDLLRAISAYDPIATDG